MYTQFEWLKYVYTIRPNHPIPQTNLVQNVFTTVFNTLESLFQASLQSGFPVKLHEYSLQLY